MTPFPPEMEGTLATMFEGHGPGRVYKFGTRGQVIGVLTAVRNRILAWSLRLESIGILGEGMTFSKDDREKAQAAPASIVIGNMQGVVGNVSGGTIQFGDLNAISKELRRVGVSRADVEELEAALRRLETAKGPERPPLAERVAGWLARHDQLAGSLVQAISLLLATALAKPA